jgi:alkylhydroperoxidase family enzyme
MLGLAPPAEPAPTSSLEDAALTLTEQFVFYVADVDESLRAPLREQLGDAGVAALVQTIYVFDQTVRLRLAHERLFDADEGPPITAPDAGSTPGLSRALADLHAAAMMLGELDPVTTEAVRLRAAAYHDCKT